LIEGDPQRGIQARGPDLKSVNDLPGYCGSIQRPRRPHQRTLNKRYTAHGKEAINGNEVSGSESAAQQSEAADSAASFAAVRRITRTVTIFGLLLWIGIEGQTSISFVRPGVAIEKK